MNTRFPIAITARMVVENAGTPSVIHKVVKLQEAHSLEEAQQALDSILVTTRLMRTPGTIEKIISSHRRMILLWIEEGTTFQWFETSGFYWYGNQLKTSIE